MTPVDVRSRLLAALEADLVGPFALGAPGASRAEAQASAEILPMPPSRWYFTGFLAPQGQRAPEKDDLESHGGDFAAGSESQAEDAGVEEPEPARPIRFPASMVSASTSRRSRSGAPTPSTSSSATPTTTRSRSPRTPRTGRRSGGSGSLAVRSASRCRSSGRPSRRGSGSRSRSGSRSSASCAPSRWRVWARSGCSASGS